MLEILSMNTHPVVLLYFSYGIRLATLGGPVALFQSASRMETVQCVWSPIEVYRLASQSCNVRSPFSFFGFQSEFTLCLVWTSVVKSFEPKVGEAASSPPPLGKFLAPAIYTDRVFLSFFTIQSTLLGLFLYFFFLRLYFCRFLQAHISSIFEENLHTTLQLKITELSSLLKWRLMECNVTIFVCSKNWIRHI